MNFGFLSLSAIFLNTTKILEMELEGIRVVIPYFIQALYRVLPTADNFPNISKANIENIQKAAYKITGYS